MRLLEGGAGPPLNDRRAAGRAEHHAECVGPLQRELVLAKQDEKSVISECSITKSVDSNVVLTLVKSFPNAPKVTLGYIMSPTKLM
jgi:hypothetical protein